MTKAHDRKSKKQTPQRMTTWRWFIGNCFGLIRRFGSLVIWAIVIVFSVHVAGTVFLAYAGKDSIADVAIRIAANFNVAFTISLATTGVSVGLYIREFRRHRQTRERLTGRITMLELQIDPNRSSSHLTRQGTTKREDL